MRDKFDHICHMLLFNKKSKELKKNQTKGQYETQKAI